MRSIDRSPHRQAGCSSSCTWDWDCARQQLAHLPGGVGTPVETVSWLRTCMQSRLFEKPQTHKAACNTFRKMGQAQQQGSGLTPSLPQPVKFPGGMMRGQYMIFSGPMTHLLSMLYVDKNKNTKTLTCQCEKKTKRHNGFKFRSFVDCFQMASWQ